MHFFFFTQHPCLIVHTLGEEKDIVAQKPRKVREKRKEKKCNRMHTNFSCTHNVFYIHIILIKNVIQKKIFKNIY
jgi:hypothetical protein